MGDQIKTTAEAIEGDVLARRIEVHTNTGSQVAEEISHADIANKSPAQWAYERLIMYIQNFEKTLDNEHEVAMGFAGGDAGVIRIEGMGFFDPDIITFYGADEYGAKTQLVQHVSQLSVIFRALPKHAEAAEPNRIGFRLGEGLKTQA